MVAKIVAFHVADGDSQNLARTRDFPRSPPVLAPVCRAYLVMQTLPGAIPDIADVKSLGFRRRPRPPEAATRRADS